MAREFLHGDVTEKILGAAFEVYRVLGYGFLEKVYRKAMIVELQLRGLRAVEEPHIRVTFKGRNVGDYSPDILVEECVIVKIKAEEKYNPKHEAQLLNYLKATGIKVGLLLNFGRGKCEFKRLVW